LTSPNINGIKPILRLLSDKLDTPYDTASKYQYARAEILYIYGMIFEGSKQYDLARESYIDGYDTFSQISGTRDPRLCKFLYRAIICGSTALGASPARETQRLIDELETLYALRAGGGQGYGEANGRAGRFDFRGWGDDLIFRTGLGGSRECVY